MITPIYFGKDGKMISRKSTIQIILLWFAVLTLTNATSATVWFEALGSNGDAGELPGSAHIAYGSGPLLNIVGQVSGPYDVDMYGIWISNPAAFTAIGPGGFPLGLPRLYLFDSAGHGVLGYVDGSNTSTLLDNTSNTITSPGLYYLAVACSTREPLDSSSNPLWATIYNWILPANGPGAANPIASWSPSVLPYMPHNYTITLTGVEFIPEPATVILISLGIFGVSRKTQCL